MDPYKDLYQKVHRLLGVPQTDVVLSGLEDLIEGKQIDIAGQIISGLEELGKHPSPSDNSYERAMSELLSWGIQRFPIQPVRAIRLWKSMAELDGNKGYSQHLLRRDRDSDTLRVEPDDFRVATTPAILPMIITTNGDNNTPIQPLPSEDFSLIIEFMKQEITVHPVTMTASLFGWPGLSTRAIVLFVDGESDGMQRLVESITGVFGLPTIASDVKRRTQAQVKKPAH